MTEYLFDGAFGTYYQSLTNGGALPELAVINNPDIVRNIHKRYIASGANAIKTNTFGANTVTYQTFESVREIIKAGFRLASDAAVKGCAVFADIGPIRSEPQAAQAEFIKIVEAFIEEGATNFLFETLPGAENVLPALRLIKNAVKNSVVITSFAVSQDGYTSDGEFYIKLFDSAAKAGADFTGLNCLCGPAHMLELVSRCDTSKYNISAMPNSGYPSLSGGRLVYIDNPGYFAQKLCDMRERGVKILGGCCGTTPEHIAAAADMLAGQSSVIPKTVIKREEPIYITPRRAETGQKLIAVEIDPPTDSDASFLLAASEKAKLCGANFITLADSPLARTRADSFMLASKVRREVGIDTIAHLTCRDKNQIAIKAQLLAGNIDGLTNVLAVTGDPVAKADRSELKDVFGFNSYKLINFISNLNSDVFRERPYNIYGALNINSASFSSELKRAEEKQKNGVSCFFTQPIYTSTHAENLRQARKRLSCGIFAGILPFASLKNALFLNNEVTGIDIPEDIIESLKDKPENEVKNISVGFCKEKIDMVYDSCDGFYIMTPMKKIDFVLDLITYIRGLRK